MAPQKRKKKSQPWSRRKKSEQKSGSAEYAYDASDAGEPMLSWAQAQQTVKLTSGQESERLTISDDLFITVGTASVPHFRTKQPKKPLPVAEYEELDSLQQEVDEVVEPPDSQQEAYVCDEEDHELLKMINSRKSWTENGKLPVLTFEDTINYLEKESIKCRGPSSGFLLPVDEDAVCSVCQKGDCDNTNMILFCDMCNLAVHQECYGVPYIPEGQWHCRRCMVSPSRPAQCMLCPTSEGALKQTEDGHWAHVICALYIPKVAFKSPQLLEPIMNIDKIEKARYKLKCVVCKQKPDYDKNNRVGVCIQCEEPTCKTAFHVTCAQKAGYFLDLKPVDEESDEGPNIGEKDAVKAIAYCERHSRNQTRRKPGRKKKQHSLSPAARNMLQTKSPQQARMDSLNIETDKLHQIAKLVKLDSASDIFNLILSYWKSKRKYRNGLPLLKRPKGRTVPQRAANHEELDALRKCIQVALQRTEKLRTLTEYQLRKDRIDFRKDKLLDIKLGFEATPVRSVISHVFDRVKALDKEKVFLYPVTDKIAPQYSDIIKKPMDFTTMKKKMDNAQYATFAAFSGDIRLIMENCLRYNTPDTFYHKYCLDFRDKVLPMLEEGQKNCDMFLQHLQDQQIPSVIDLPTTVPNKPLSPRIVVEPLVESTNKNQYSQEIMSEISSGEESDRPVEPMDVDPDKTADVSPPPPSNSTGSSSSPVNSRTIPSSPRARKSPLGKRLDALLSRDDSDEPESGSARKRMRTTPMETHDNGESSSRVPTPNDVPVMPPSMKDYRNGPLIALASESELDLPPFTSEDSTDVQSSDYDFDSDSPISRRMGRRILRRSKDSLDFNTGDFVWAETDELPYPFPGVVADFGAEGAVKIGSFEIPAIPKEMRSAGKPSFDSKLICLLNSKRTLVWVEKNQLEFLHVDPAMDNLKMSFCRKESDLKAVKKAFETAIGAMGESNGGSDWHNGDLHVVSQSSRHERADSEEI